MFYPKCLTLEAKEVLTNTGHILPCCYIDTLFARKHPLLDALYSEHLKVSNVDNKEEIILSEEWQRFFDMIIEEDNIPEPCRRECGQTRDGTVDTYMDTDVIKIIE